MDNALALLPPLAVQQQVLRLRFDMRVSIRYFYARIPWLQGVADQAKRAVALCIEEGRTVGHALNFCSALGQSACPISFLSGDLGVAARYGAMLIEHTERYPIRLWRLWARCFLSLVAVRRGEVYEGLATLRAELEQVGEARSLPRFLLIRGEYSACLGHAGQIADGLATINDTLHRCKPRDEAWYLPELLRIKGELFLKEGGPASVADATECFNQALVTAQRQGVLFWELRSALSLARLLVAEVRPDAARTLLTPVYLKFTEGFDTADMIAARALLDAAASA
jgi:predicted ATPase